MKQLIFLSALLLIPFLMNAQGTPTTLTATGITGTGGGWTSTYIGTNAGKANNTSSDHKWNTFVGSFTGINSTSSAQGNSFFGASAGVDNQNGDRNTFIGNGTGKKSKGSNNTFLGWHAGHKTINGTGNVFLGYAAGYSENNSYNKLWIDNCNGCDALIYGDFNDDYVVIAGGKKAVDKPSLLDPSVYGLYVTKGILTEKVKVADVDSGDWSDYVFEADYHLNSVEEVETFIKENKHLPNVPSAKEVSENGVDMVEMDATLLRQIEELWLHMIELKKENENVKAENEMLKIRVNTLENK